MIKNRMDAVFHHPYQSAYAILPPWLTATPLISIVPNVVFDTAVQLVGPPLERVVVGAAVDAGADEPLSPAEPAVRLPPISPAMPLSRQGR